MDNLFTRNVSFFEDKRTNLNDSEIEFTASVRIRFSGTKVPLLTVG